MVRYCSVFGCLENTNENKSRRFFGFPSDELRSKQWLKAAGRWEWEHKDVKVLHKSYFICELHFTESDCRKKYLKPNAVPTLRLPQMENLCGTTKYTQTDFDSYSATENSSGTSDYSIVTNSCPDSEGIATSTIRQTTFPKSIESSGLSNHSQTCFPILAAVADTLTHTQTGSLNVGQTCGLSNYAPTYFSRLEVGPGTSVHTPAFLYFPKLEEGSDPSNNILTSFSKWGEVSKTSKDTQTDFSILCSNCKAPADVPTTSHSTGAINFSSGKLPQKRKLVLQLQPEGKKLKFFESATTSKEFDLPSRTKNTRIVLKESEKKARGNRFSQEYIMFALNIYYTSPLAYRLLSKILCLPNVITIRRRIAFGMGTKLDENVVKCLKSKSRNLSKSEKYCVLCADEISLKKHLYYHINKDKVVGFQEINEKQGKKVATRALMVMARGIFSNWKQPLAFCYLSEDSNPVELNTWMENILQTVIEIGFNVCALVTNQDTKLNMDVAKSVSPEQPYFFVNGRKIYYIFDVPQLIKSLRTSLKDHDFVYHDDDELEQVASWDDISKGYYLDKNNEYRMCYKLKTSHIKLNNKQKHLVKYATQVLSRTVAVTISNLVESGKLHEKAKGTAKFLKLMNDCFDILNSSTVNDDYKYKRAFCHADFQTNALQKARHTLSGLRVINRKTGADVTDTIKCIKGLLTSIEAISNLASDLKTAGYNKLFTRRLNNDVLDNFFTKVRRKGNASRDSTAIQFLKAFKKFFVMNIIRHSDKGNCNKDLDDLLTSNLDSSALISAQNALQSHISESSNRALEVGTNDYRFELPEGNSLTYLSGYLLKKCYDYHKGCEAMEEYIENKDEIRNFKAYGNDLPYDAIISAPEDFKQYIKAIDTICQDHFINNEFHHIGNEIMSKISGVSFNQPCPCFPMEYLRKLFIRFRIYNVLRHNNKKLKGSKSPKEYLNLT